ncbi:MAG: sigma-70 family RNA polymerase sigma factor [Fibrobacter sp.]|nr:sigma-70 family RNA polymerase sigma factor [Fibrobacter sp.]
MGGLEERDSQTPDWLETTWNKYAPKIYKLCCKKCKNVEDAKELFQTVALKFCQNARKLNFQKNAMPWFLCVMTNARYDQVRAKSRAMQPLSLADVSVEYMEFPEEMALRFTHVTEVQNKLDRAMTCLTELEKAIVHLTFMSGLTLEEMSMLFGISANSILKRKSRAITKLRENLQKDQVICDFFSHNAI